MVFESKQKVNEKMPTNDKYIQPVQENLSI